MRQCQADPGLIRSMGPVFTPEQAVAVRTWNMMGYVIEWEAVPVFCEMFAVEDTEQFIHDLVTIRNFMDRVSAEKRK